MVTLVKHNGRVYAVVPIGRMGLSTFDISRLSEGRKITYNDIIEIHNKLNDDLFSKDSGVITGQKQKKPSR
jgi:hypothetical protein